MSFTSVDLPLPETPVTTMNRPSGNSTSMFLRLCSRAPCSTSFLPLPRPPLGGLLDARAPERYWPVSDSGFARDVLRASRRPPGSRPAGPAPGPEIDHVIGALDGFRVVLDHQHGIAHVAQPGERVEQAAVVARVQTDGGLVEHIQHAAQLGADLRGQADALRLAAGERVRRAVQAQVIQADGAEELEAVADLFGDAPGDLPLALVELPGARRRSGQRHAVNRDEA